MSPNAVSPKAATQKPRRNSSAVSSDAGTTLAELTVAMALTTIIMAAFTAAIVQMYRISSTIVARETAQAQVHTAFVRVSRQLGYAYGITQPGQVGTDWYVEYVTTNTGSAICGQLRLNTAAAQLQSRSWARGQTPSSTWTVLASDVSGTTPFQFYEASNTYGPAQQLHLRLTASVGSGASAATRQIDERFTAINTSVRTPTLRPADACILRG